MNHEIKNVETYYRKAHRKMENSLQRDEFYTYFKDVMKTAQKEVFFSNEEMIKEIEMEWLLKIEHALPFIENVIKVPRRFLRKEEEVVNIALSRKTGIDAIKHLSQHTNLIDKIDENGSIIPNRILNTYNEETLDTYENRFVYALINQLYIFLSIRCEALLADSSNNKGAELKFSSRFMHSDEIVKCDFAIHVLKTQDYKSSEYNQKKIDRLKKVKEAVDLFYGGAFSKEMRMYTMVRPPIMKTNAIMKNQNYKECYELFNFLFKYDKVGYTIKTYKQENIIDDIFMETMYDNVLFEYLTLKHHIKNLDEKKVMLKLASKKERKPKVLKEAKVNIKGEGDVAYEEVHHLQVDQIARAINANQLKELEKKFQRYEKIRRKEEERLERQREAKRQRQLLKKQKEEALRIERLEAKKERERLRKEKEQEQIKKRAQIEKEKQQKLVQKEKMRIQAEKEKIRAKKKKQLAIEKERLRKEKKRKSALEKKMLIQIEKEKKLAIEIERLCKEMQQKKVQEKKIRVPDVKKRTRAEKKKQIAKEKEQLHKKRNRRVSVKHNS